MSTMTDPTSDLSDVVIVDTHRSRNHPPQRFRNSAPWWQRHRTAINGVVFSLVIFGVSRVLTAGAIWFGTRLIPGRDMSQAFLSWDSGWYYNVILNGYPHIATGPEAIPQNNVAFFPLFPMFARFLQSIFGGTALQVGIAASIISGATATIALWFLARKVTNARTANIAVALFCFAPASVSMLLLMSEGVMLTFAICCLLALLNRQWMLAGLCSAFATAARPTALVLVACCVWASAVAIWQRREWRSLIAPVLAPGGILAYFAFLKHHTGDFFAWQKVEEAGWGYGEIDRWKAFTVLPDILDPLTDMNNSATALALLLAIVGLGLLAYWRPPMIFVIFSLGICYFAYGVGGGTASKLRYIWTAFPFAIAAAYWAKTELRSIALIGTAALSLGIYAIIETHTTYSIL